MIRLCLIGLSRWCNAETKFHWKCQAKLDVARQELGIWAEHILRQNGKTQELSDLIPPRPEPQIKALIYSRRNGRLIGIIAVPFLSMNPPFSPRLYKMTGNVKEEPAHTKSFASRCPPRTPCREFGDLYSNFCHTCHCWRHSLTSRDLDVVCTGRGNAGGQTSCPSHQN